MRGVLHKYAFFVALAAAWALVAATPEGPGRVATGIYALTLCGLFGISALYHRITWPWRVRPWIRRLDHTMIFIFIAGSYTPFALLVLDGPVAGFVFSFMWIAAICGLVVKLLWINAPTWIGTGLYIAVGWSSVVVLPEMLSTIGMPGAALVAIGGLVYTLGGITHAVQWPNPSPRVFGYHEVFHACVCIGATAHFLAIAFFVMPLGTS